jgi:hypothetical protein
MRAVEWRMGDTRSPKKDWVLDKISTQNRGCFLKIHFTEYRRQWSHQPHQGKFASSTVPVVLNQGLSSHGSGMMSASVLVSAPPRNKLKFKLFDHTPDLKLKAKL